MWFVYKYIKGEEIVYVGHTTDMKQRQKTHKIDEYKDFELWYVELPTESDMMYYEEYLIRTYRPIYNKQYMGKPKTLFSMTPVVPWVRYEHKNNEEGNKSLSAIDKLKIHEACALLEKIKADGYCDFSDLSLMRYCNCMTPNDIKRWDNFFTLQKKGYRQYRLSKLDGVDKMLENMISLLEQLA